MAAAQPPRRILVTGATGFVGRHLLPALRAALPEATIVATARDGTSPAADASVTLDLADAEAIAGLVRQVMPDAVLHLGAQAAVPASFADPLGTWRVNLLGTLALAEAVLRTVPDCLFLQASSAEIYGLSFAE